MSEATSSAYTAACLCGGIKLEITTSPLMSAACHCSGCQKMTSSAYSLSHVFPQQAVRLVAGETVLGALRGPSKHHYCASCFSWVYSEPEGMDDLIVVRTTMLDPLPTDPPFIEVFRGEGLPWAQTGSRHSFEASVEPEAFPVLIAEYQSMAST